MFCLLGGLDGSQFLSRDKSQLSIPPLKGSALLGIAVVCDSSLFSDARLELAGCRKISEQDVMSMDEDTLLGCFPLGNPA